MIVAFLTLPIFLIIGLLSVLMTKNKQLNRYEAAMAETKVGTTSINEFLAAQAENRDPDWNKLCCKDISRINFNARLNSFLHTHFPGMVRYYNDNPCNIYEDDIFFVNIVYATGEKKKVFLKKVPSMEGATFRMLDEPTPAVPESEEIPTSPAVTEPENESTDEENAPAPEENAPQEPDTPQEESEFSVQEWLKTNLPEMTKKMNAALSEKKDAFRYEVPDNEELKEALESEGFYIFEDCDTNDTYVSF